MSSTVEYEKSLVLIKPDGVRRRLTGQILQRFENAGIKIHAQKLIHATQEQAGVHYDEHREKPFFNGAVNYLASSPIMALVLGGFSGISKIRTLTGVTSPAEAAPGTIRGDFAHIPFGGNYIVCNLIHASSCKEDAEREIKLWFNPDEILDYKPCDEYYHGHADFKS